MRAIALSILIFVLSPAAGVAKDNTDAIADIENTVRHQDLRLYRVNKDGIESRFWFTRGKGRKTGCHNIRKRSRLFRAVQFGYQSCRVYKKKDCSIDSEVKFTRKDDDSPTPVLEQGYSWFAIDDHKRGPRIKSWSCTH